MLSVEVPSPAPVWPRLSTAPLSALAAQPTPLPVAVLGAGPVGLAAVAKLIERHLPFIVLEANEHVGANLLDYGHVQLFSPWRYNVDPTMAKLLQPTGWQPPEPSELPLAGDIARRVLQPFAQLPQVAARLHLRTRVVSVSREGYDKVKSQGRETAPFIIRAMRDGQAIQLRARAVIDSTGTWNTPNPVGASGLPAMGEREAARHIFYGIPDVLGLHRARYAGKKTLVVGAGHSAANALLALAELAKQVPNTQLVWSVRTPVLTRVFGGGDADALPARGALGASLRRLRDTGALEFNAGLRITEITQEGGKLLIAGVDGKGEPLRIDAVDEIICATGQRPDLSLTSELRVKLDPWLESNEALGPLIDPNEHSCGTVRPHGHRELSHPEPGLYTVGVKSYGRAPTFLMATGFEQVRSVVAAIAGDFEAADRVELSLPETGVCGTGVAASEARECGAGCGVSETGSAPVDAVASGCCGGPAKADASACCVLDEHMKAQGAVGCGCSQTKTQVAVNAAPCCG
jgi:thioredoxin reductase